MKLRKIICTVLAMIMVCFVLPVASISVSAKSIFDNAINMKAKELYSYDLDNGEHIYNRITIPSSGVITIRTGECNQYVHIRLINENADEIGDYGIWGNDVLKFEKLSAGTYYADVYGVDDGHYVKDIYYSFTPDEKPTVTFKMTVTKGSTIQLGTVTSNYSGSVSWSTSKKTVAAVYSKGIVTAAAKGTARIRAKLDNGDYIDIYIVVKNKDE